MAEVAPDPLTELFLVLECDAAAARRLEAALAVHPAASILLSPAEAGPLSAAVVQPLVAIAQEAGAAALIRDDAALALATKADGIHLAHRKDASALYAAARGVLGPRLIVGADGGRLRHDAMELAEAGADYIGFGLGGEGAAEPAAAAERRLERIAWWAEIFEVPCVAFEVETAKEALALARAGADFIGLTLRAGESPPAAAERVSAISAALAAGLP